MKNKILFKILNNLLILLLIYFIYKASFEFFGFGSYLETMFVVTLFTIITFLVYFFTSKRKIFWMTLIFFFTLSWPFISYLEHGLGVCPDVPLKMRNGPCVDGTNIEGTMVCRNGTFYSTNPPCLTNFEQEGDGMIAAGKFTILGSITGILLGILLQLIYNRKYVN